MRHWRRLVVAVVVAAWTARAPADDRDMGGASSAEAPAPGPAEAPPPPAAPATAAPWRNAFAATVGLGYYERLHLGVAYQRPESSLGVFAGSNLGLGDAATWAVGLAYGHRLWQGREGLEAGWDAKAMYWEQSNPDYHWKMTTLGLGAYLARELRPALTLALDGGVALSFDVGVRRKQNVNFEYPTRWNGSVCLELRYRFDQW